MTLVLTLRALRLSKTAIRPGERAGLRGRPTSLLPRDELMCLRLEEIRL